MPQWGAVNLEPYLRGLELFNHAEFFEAHEALEDVWQAMVGPERKFLQGLIQIAVAFHHHSRGNLVGARSVLRRAVRNLSAYPEDFGGIHLPLLLHSLADWQKAMDEGTPVPSVPQIVVRGRASVARKRRRAAKKERLNRGGMRKRRT